MSNSFFFHTNLYFVLLIHYCHCFNFETNKIVVHQPTFAQNAHFGYTVAGYKVANDPAWILVGAPQTIRERTQFQNSKQQQQQSTRSREGAVYRCSINNPNNCYMLPFDKKDWHEVRDQYGMYLSENKTDQLLGATLSVVDDVILGVLNFLNKIIFIEFYLRFK
jgi:hypothetical protein